MAELWHRRDSGGIRMRRRVQSRMASCRKGDVGWDKPEPEPGQSSAGRYDNNRAKQVRI